MNDRDTKGPPTPRDANDLTIQPGEADYSRWLGIEEAQAKWEAKWARPARNPAANAARQFVLANDRMALAVAQLLSMPSNGVSPRAKFLLRRALVIDGSAYAEQWELADEERRLDEFYAAECAARERSE